jgi:hypothetical protein
VAGAAAGGRRPPAEPRAGPAYAGQPHETDEGQRKEVGEETSDPEGAAAMLEDAEKDPEAKT